jgi:hypothetical protein
MLPVWWWHPTTHRPLLRPDKDLRCSQAVWYVHRLRWQKLVQLHPEVPELARAHVTTVRMWVPLSSLQTAGQALHRLATRETYRTAYRDVTGLARPWEYAGKARPSLSDALAHGRLSPEARVGDETCAAYGLDTPLRVNAALQLQSAGWVSRGVAVHLPGRLRSDLVVMPGSTSGKLGLRCTAALVSDTGSVWRLCDNVLCRNGAPITDAIDVTRISLHRLHRRIHATQPRVPLRGSVPQHVSYWQRRYNKRDRVPQRIPLALHVSDAPTAAGAATRWLLERVQAGGPGPVGFV